MRDKQDRTIAVKGKLQAYLSRGPGKGQTTDVSWNVVGVVMGHSNGAGVTVDNALVIKLQDTRGKWSVSAQGSNQEHSMACCWHTQAAAAAIK